MRYLFSFFIAKILGDCPEGWKAYSDSCYHAEEASKVSWNVAQSRCQAYGGDLVSLEDNSVSYRIFLKNNAPKNFGQYEVFDHIN